jgi:cytochrome P450
MTDVTDAPAIDLTANDAYDGHHPWDQYAWLRANDPVHWHPEADGPGFWAITKYADIRSVSRQPKLFSSAAKGVGLRESGEAELAASRQMMLVMDPPQHDRFKLLVSRGFTPKAAQSLRARIEELATEIVDDVYRRGECDFVHDISGRLPSGLIAELMGIPRADGERLYELTELMHTTDDAVASPEQRAAATFEMLSYAGETAARKRVQPGEDIASQLVQAEVDGERLTDAELKMFFFLLVIAGNDTVRSALPGGVLLLLRHPAEYARLRADPSLLPSAIEEMLRLHPPVLTFRRTATRDLTLGGREIRAGDKVVVYHVSANVDERRFPDPFRFDVARSPNDHVAFGQGPHLCLGAAFARLQMREFFSEFLRLPQVELDGEPRRLVSNFINGLTSLPLRW